MFLTYRLHKLSALLDMLHKGLTFPLSFIKPSKGLAALQSPSITSALGVKVDGICDLLYGGINKDVLYPVQCVTIDLEITWLP